MINTIHTLITILCLSSFMQFVYERNIFLYVYQYMSASQQLRWFMSQTFIAHINCWHKCDFILHFVAVH